jgi:DNA invertase Pin-like site-specific DNA recombinase
MALDPLPLKDLKRLRELGEAAQELRYAPAEESEPVQLERDEIIYRLAWDGWSATAIARAANVHRTFVYRVKDNYEARLRRWEARQKK